MSTIEPVVGRPIKSLSCLDMGPLEEAEKHITNTMSMTRKTRRMSTFAVMQQESMRERLNKAREERSNRAVSLTGNHRHVMAAAAFHLNVELKVVEDGVLDSWSHIKHLESFMSEGGRRAIFFFYQEFDEGPPLDSGRGGGPARGVGTAAVTQQGTEGEGGGGGGEDGGDEGGDKAEGAAAPTDEPPTKVRASAMQPAIQPAVSTASDARGPKPEGPRENWRVVVTSGAGVQAHGRCCVAFRTKLTPVDAKTLIEDMYFLSFEVNPETADIVAAVAWVLSTVTLPQLAATLASGWQSEVDRKEFFAGIDDFIHFLENTSHDLGGRTVLQPSELWSMGLPEPEEVLEMSSNLNVVEGVEDIMRVWTKQIEQVLIETAQLRREQGTAGPHAELVYWRHVLACYMAIVEQIKAPKCRLYVQLLTLAKSKLLKDWQELDQRVTNACNEADDNVKYLYALERYCHPLYHADPTVMGMHLPALLYTVRMVYASSRFYNSTERITSLLVKVTNQMVAACRAYLDENGTRSVWAQRKRDVLHKIDVCLNLHKTYHECFEKARRAMLNTPVASDQPFEISEMYVFGKFQTFRIRIMKLAHALKTSMKYSILESSCIEGIDAHAHRFKELYTQLTQGDYDPLDHRRPDFETDYQRFKKGIAQAETDLRQFMLDSVDAVPTIYEKLRLMARFEKLPLVGLCLDHKYSLLLDTYQTELEELRDRYNDERKEPPLARLMTPIAGRVMWVRYFYRRMEEPMNIFKKKAVIRAEKARRTIKLYNVLAQVFVHCEMVYHNAWTKCVKQLRTALAQPLLTQNAQRRMKMNLKPYVTETLLETEALQRLGLGAPDEALMLCFCKDKLLQLVENVRELVRRNDQFRMNIPLLFVPLMRPSLLRLDQAFLPALCDLTWTSVQVPTFCESMNKLLHELEIFLQEVKDIKEARIEETFYQIANTLLLQFPKEPVTGAQLLDMNTEYVQQTAHELEIRSFSAERATLELITKLLERIPVMDVSDDDPVKFEWLDRSVLLKTTDDSKMNPISPNAAFKDMEPFEPFELETVHFDCMELFCYFNNKNLESLVRATRKTFDELKSRAFLSGHETNKTSPLYLTSLQLKIPDIVLVPPLEELQRNFNRLVNMALEEHDKVSQWGQRFKPVEARDKAISRQVTRALSGRQPPANDWTRPRVSYVPLPDLHEAVDGGMLRGVSFIPSGGIRFQDGTTSRFDTYMRQVSEHKEVMRAVMAVQGAILLVRPDVSNVIAKYSQYSHLWADDREETTRKLAHSDPILQDVETTFTGYQEICDEIANLPDEHVVGPLLIRMNSFKEALGVEAAAWKRLYGRDTVAFYKVRLDDMCHFIDDMTTTLQKPIKDLEGVRLQMKTLNTITMKFIEMDFMLDEMENLYATLQHFNVDVNHEDMERVESLRYNFENMLTLSKQVREQLCQVQEPFKIELLECVDQLKRDVAKFDVEFELNGPMVPGISAREASDRVLLFQAWFDDLWSRYETYSSGEMLFGLPETEYPELMNRKKELSLLNKLYDLYNQVMRSIDGYFDTTWADVDLEIINTEITDFKNRCQRLPKGLKDWPAYIDLNNKINDFCETIPLLELMTNKAMKDRHWARLSTLLKYEFKIDKEGFTLKSVMDAPLLKFKDEVEDICISAVKEKDIEAKLNQVIADWSIVEFSFAPFKNRGELLLKGQEAAEIIGMLEDSLMILSSLMTNRYNEPYKKEIQQWVQNLSNTSEILENWIMVQNLWVYLEAVFVGGDIAKQLPQEAKRFQTIDKNWMKIMQRAHDVPNVVECCVNDETMISLLPHLLEQLETCQKSLTGYLESKRLIFPRFFFVSDPALLEILGQASDSHTIQNHLLSIFDNVFEVRFSEKEYDRIEAVLSREGEEVPLEHPVMCVGGVETWMGTLLLEQQSSLGAVITNMVAMLNEPDFDIIAIEFNFPAQVGLLGIQILWTRESEDAIQKARWDRSKMLETNQRFLDLLNLFIGQTVKELTKWERVKFETLVTIHLHQRDIFDEMCKLRVKTVTDFEWLKQSRFYYDDETEVVTISITDVNFIYQNEFLGCTERLVVTPLTDRCYITLSQALGMSMGGAPAGPAGTGKTETTKDMGRCLGKYVVVFNCSDQMDFRGLGRIYKGLAQSGSWGCFDEFNRIELPVLSVAAQQIAIVLAAKKERKTMFIFTDGDNVSLNPEFGLFITMNPGYAGRQELPENLKINFRTVAMMVPDRMIIMRVKLASCGFLENIPLSRKFFTLYKLCEEQLSKQVHYDFGLRNILSVLRTLGAQKRANPTDSEDTTVMRVLRDMNLSKLVDEDEPLFLSLIEDLFPGIKLTTSTYKELQRGIANACTEFGYINHPGWNLKVVQFYETSLVRHGLMALGPTGAGKTSCIHTLMRAMTEMGKPHREMRMNPKAITAPQMFGRLDVATNDWTDGIFSTLWRKTLKVKPTENVWLVLDGPVDAVWIENLNSVLDDNKTLTLANGDRITMAPNSKLLFEPDNVDNASPATVSRMGMVFISASSLPWPPILDGWLLTRPDAEGGVLRNLFHRIYGDLHEFVQTKLKAKMKILESIYIRQATDVMQGLLLDGTDDHSDQHLGRLFLFTLMWSLGAVLELEDRDKMEEFVLEHPSKLDWPKTRPGETIFEYLVGNNGQWIHWNEQVEEYIYPSDSVPDYSSILVPNVDNVRTGFLIDNIAKQSKAVLLIGEQGTAKTVMVKGYTSKYDPEVQIFKSFNFSSASTPNMFQRIIESYVDKRVGTTYGPPGNRKMTVFVDDINMPVINEWGDQVTNEIVRQLMEYGGFYSLDKPGDYSTIVDIQMLAAMNHPGGGRNDVPPRLKRQFNIFNCTLPSNASMDKIFSVIAEGYFCLTRFKPEIVAIVPKLILLTRRMWQLTKAKMLPTPAKFHYIFNLRDLSRIWQGILYIQDTEVPTPTTMLKLWAHESRRVISDRFTNQDDRNWFESNLDRCVREFMPRDDQKWWDFGEYYFVDFLRVPPEPTGDEEEEICLEAPKMYEEIPNYEAVLGRLEEYVRTYNEEVRGAAMDLVFFHDALMHLMIISRIVRTPRGNALLVGVGGSGKQSLTRLASHIAGYSFFQISLTRSYNVSNFLEDLKYLYRVAGKDGKGISFIFTDNDVKDEAFLEFLNNVLSAGEVANLFAKDETDEIMAELIPVMKKSKTKKPITPDNLYEFFITRSRNNLHVVLCFSPVGEKFRSRALKFPGLISGCTIDWFARWPRDALVAVADHYIMPFSIVCKPEVKVQLIELMGEVQDEVADVCTDYYDRFRRQTYVTPKSFLSFVDSYKKIYQDRFDTINTNAKKMSMGLSKLLEAQQSVDLLKKELEVMNKDIKVATAKAEKVLAVVTESAKAAEKVKAEVQVVKDRAQTLVDSIAEDKKVADVKLEAALPALQAAEAALNTIKPADIATVRKLGKPPYLITVIMDAVCVLFQRRLAPVEMDTEKNFLMPSWAESLKVMSDTRFLSMLQNYPKDKINGEMVDLLEPYLMNPLYTFENAKQACGNVAGLLSWTQAMAQFYHVNKEVLPLKANLAIQEAKLQGATHDLNEAQAQLDEKQRELQGVQAMFDKAMAEKQAVMDEAAKCQSKMDAATALIDGLAGERIRWTEQSAAMKSEIERLIGDVLILAGFLSYAGPFNQEFRSQLYRSWVAALNRRHVPASTNLSVIDCLTDAPTIGEWNLQGLPDDELSVQNGIITTKAPRFPLMIDPQGQGKTWVKNMEAENSIMITTLDNKYFRNQLEDSISLGLPLLIEDVGEELDPVLDNVLEKNFIKVGTKWKVKLGDKEVDVEENKLRIYLTTKLPNPAYTPEIFAKTSIIDFTVTMKGLEDQLLGRVILSEKRELETERVSLLMDVTLNKRKMQELEENLLLKLTTVQGSLLDDDTVLEVLTVTKNTAAEVRTKLQIASDTAIKITAAREEFRPVATRGSVLYFLIVDMAKVNYMYQTSLGQFLERFDISMARSEKSPITQRRIGFIIEYLTYDVWFFTCRGFYEDHKFLFTLLVTLKIDLQRDAISFTEFQTFIKGGAALDLNDCDPKPFAWISDMTWLNLVELSKLRQFQNILEHVSGNEKGWKGWFDKDAPEEETIPDGYQALDVFRRLLLVRSWCPDRTLAQSRKYVAESMGTRFSEAVITKYDVLLEESRPMTPLVCFLSMGSDPTTNIEQLAKRLMTQVVAISMGQGQEVHARKHVARCMPEGHWVLLQNCHLGLAYMNELFLLLSENPKTHDDFRLWITTECHPSFPISMLQISIKYTNDPPQGMRAGLSRTYGSMNQDFLEYTTAPQYLPLIYGVSFLHSVVQERRKFGPLGWNIPYEFNFADWYASCCFMQNHLDDIDPKHGVSWTTIRYMLGEIQYGGRVTDDYDKRLLNTFCKVWFCEDLFSETFQFYKGYKMLTFKSLQSYMAAIAAMSVVDPPQVYGLHSNADISFQASVTKNILETIVSIQPKEAGGGGGGESREGVVARLTKDMLGKLPPDYDPFEVKQRLQAMGALSSMNIFLRQEIDRMQKVIKMVRETLKDLLLAIDGTIIMNEALRDSLDNIYDARVPQMWRRSSWPSATLGFWFTELLERNSQFSSWIFTGRPISFWMTGFFNPQGFLTAMRQEVARAHKGWSLDAVVLHNEVTKWAREEIKRPPDEGVLVYGLYLEGAGWDKKRQRLVESISKVLYVYMPIIHIFAINYTGPKDPKLYQVPVYKKPNRTDLTFVTPLWLPSGRANPDHWTLRGVALLCDIS